MSNGKGKVRLVNQLGMFGLHEGTRSQYFCVGTGSGRADVGQSGIVGTVDNAYVGQNDINQHKRPVQASKPAPAPARASASDFGGVGFG